MPIVILFVPRNPIRNSRSILCAPVRSAIPGSPPWIVFLLTLVGGDNPLETDHTPPYVQTPTYPTPSGSRPADDDRTFRILWESVCTSCFQNRRCLNSHGLVPIQVSVSSMRIRVALFWAISGRCLAAFELSLSQSGVNIPLQSRLIPHEVVAELLLVIGCSPGSIFVTTALLVL